MKKGNYNFIFITLAISIAIVFVSGFVAAAMIFDGRTAAAVTSSNFILPGDTPEIIDAKNFISNLSLREWKIKRIKKSGNNITIITVDQQSRAEMTFVFSSKHKSFDEKVKTIDRVGGKFKFSVALYPQDTVPSGTDYHMNFLAVD